MKDRLIQKAREVVMDSYDLGPEELIDYSRLIQSVFNALKSEHEAALEYARAEIYLSLTTPLSVFGNKTAMEVRDEFGSDSVIGTLARMGVLRVVPKGDGKL